MGATPKIRRSKKADQFDDGNKLWETRQLGASPEHAVRVSEQKDKALDNAMGLQLLTFRVQKELIQQLKLLAKIEGIGYQPLMRQVLTKYVRENEHKLQELLTPNEASEKAEKLFLQALKYKDMISSLKEMTNKRIAAESEFSAALCSSNLLFSQAHERCEDPVLKRHLNLRLSQIASLLCDPPQKQQNKRPAKK